MHNKITKMWLLRRFKCLQPTPAVGQVVTKDIVEQVKNFAVHK